MNRTGTRSKQAKCFRNTFCENTKIFKSLHVNITKFKFTDAKEIS